MELTTDLMRRTIWRMKDRGRLGKQDIKSHGELHKFLTRVFSICKPKNVDLQKFEPGRIEAITTATYKALQLLYSGYEVKIQCYHLDGVMLYYWDNGEEKEHLYKV